jgi:hypothetical protein
VWLEYKTIQVLCWSLSAVVENYGYIDDSSTQNSYNSHSLSGQRNLSASPSGVSLYHNQQRAEGKSHNAAVRDLAFKWIRILFKYWKSNNS